MRLHSFHLLLRDEVTVHFLKVPQEVRVRHHRLRALPTHVFDAADNDYAFGYHLVNQIVKNVKVIMHVVRSD